MAEVTVYTTSTCPWCVKLKSFLAEEGISFHEVNIGQDPEAARQMVELTGQRSVPVTTLPEKQIIIAAGEGGKRRLQLGSILHRLGWLRRPPIIDPPWCGGYGRLLRRAEVSF